MHSIHAPRASTPLHCQPPLTARGATSSGWRREGLSTREGRLSIFTSPSLGLRRSRQPRGHPECPMNYGLPPVKLPQFERVGVFSFYGTTGSLSATLIRPQTRPLGLSSTKAENSCSPPLRPGAISIARALREPGWTSQRPQGLIFLGLDSAIKSM